MAVVATNLNPQRTAFRRRNDAPGSGWNALCRGLENDPLFSDIRHEGALRKYRAGWHPNEIQRLLGHRNIQQTSTYLGVGNDDLAQAMIAHGSGGKQALDGVPAWTTDAIQTAESGQPRRRQKSVSDVS
jgi:integrase